MGGDVVGGSGSIASIGKPTTGDVFANGLCVERRDAAKDAAAKTGSGSFTT
jgi:hypothetical protein